MGILHRAAPDIKWGALLGCAGWASFYDTPRRLSPTRNIRLFGLLGLAASQVGRPKVGPALLRGPLGLGTPPSINFGMVAGREDVRDRTALPELRPGVLRIFEQPLGETF